MTGAPPRRPVRVWDVPTRLFHWTLVALVLAMWLTGDARDIALHTQLGVALTGLLVFRLLWGFAGSETARFGRFVKGPGAVLAYLRGGGKPHVGHNPLGGWAVAAMLALLVAQCALGLVAHDVDGLESGPLSHFVSYDTADLARIWHHRLFDLIVALATLHVGAVLFYFVARDEDLVMPMITGMKEVPAHAPAPRAASPAALLLCLGLALLLAWWIGQGAPLPAAPGGG
jgi:cytochrome b